MEELLRTLLGLEYIKSWYPEHSEMTQEMQYMLISKAIQGGIQFSAGIGSVSLEYSGFVFSINRKNAEKYMNKEWLDYVFGNDTKNTSVEENRNPQTEKETPVISRESGIPIGTQERSVPLKETIDISESMKKEDFTYTAVVFNHIGGGRITSVKVMASPIDNNKTLFWYNNGEGEYIDVQQEGVNIPIVDKICHVGKANSDKFRITITPEKGCKVEPRFGSGGDGGHIIFTLPAAKVHIIPKNYKQNPDKSANIIYYVEVADGREYCMEGKEFELDGSRYEISTVWSEDRVLTAGIRNI